jgi:hypothetical protein
MKTALTTTVYSVINNLFRTEQPCVFYSIVSSMGSRIPTHNLTICNWRSACTAMLENFALIKKKKSQKDYFL